jgi:hypothetical protein
MINKKAAIDTGQIFIYILSLFIVSLILIFGYTAISGFVEKSCTVQMLQFKKNTEYFVKSYSTEYGSEATKMLTSPCNTRKLCITGYYSQNNNLVSCNSGSSNEVIKDAYGAGISGTIMREKKNIYLLDSQNRYIDSFYAGNISMSSVSCNFFCISTTSGNFNLKLKGKGDHVEVSPS